MHFIFNYCQTKYFLLSPIYKINGLYFSNAWLLLILIDQLYQGNIKFNNYSQFTIQKIRLILIIDLKRIGTPLEEYGKYVYKEVSACDLFLVAQIQFQLLVNMNLKLLSRDDHISVVSTSNCPQYFQLKSQLILQNLFIVQVSKKKVNLVDEYFMKINVNLHLIKIVLGYQFLSHAVGILIVIQLQVHSNQHIFQLNHIKTERKCVNILLEKFVAMQHVQIFHRSSY
ncbi:unnamed protein product [Paramecium pentaurelia]|uniref:Uncharacterized protein n=1 Tax=Paramecium pentaurelia TaxID=43138 RepID=A0A8S1YQH1_9CILI|nr:unnamed protein product [Paramecium pentaurelia]